MDTNLLTKELNNFGIAHAMGYTLYYHNHKLIVEKDGHLKKYTAQTLTPTIIECAIAKHVVIYQQRSFLIDHSFSC